MPKRKQSSSSGEYHEKAKPLPGAAREFLVKEIMKRKDVIEMNNEERAAEGCRARARAWREVTDLFNRRYSPAFNRTTPQLMSYYQRRKCELKKMFSREKRYANQTGGGRDEREEFEIAESIARSMSSGADKLIIQLLAPSPAWSGIAGESMESGLKARREAQKSLLRSRMPKEGAPESEFIARAFNMERGEKMRKRAKELRDGMIQRSESNHETINLSESDDNDDEDYMGVEYNEIPKKEKGELNRRKRTNSILKNDTRLSGMDKYISTKNKGRSQLKNKTINLSESDDNDDEDYMGVVYNEIPKKKKKGELNRRKRTNSTLKNDTRLSGGSGLNEIIEKYKDCRRQISNSTKNVNWDSVKTKMVMSHDRRMSGDSSDSDSSSFSIDELSLEDRERLKRYQDVEMTKAKLDSTLKVVEIVDKALEMDEDSIDAVTSHGPGRGA